MMKTNIKRVLLIAALAVPVSCIVSSAVAQSKSVKENTDPDPEFVGGKKELQRYLDANLKYPTEARSAKKEGIVYISFTVTETGKIIDPKVVRSIGAGCDEEALRLVEEMPNWKPGKEDGKIKDLPVVIPIAFRLD